ncbi:MAG: acyltransferase [Terracidiphilus sp.]|jgi:peptidoglycan/LPS O-acetylase OafA/YrhL
MTRFEAPARSARFIELDSLRGLAALNVVLYHLQILWAPDTLSASPIVRSFLVQMAPSGTEAVILFFVLSGFVLSLPALAGKSQPYFTFMVRRIFRIYVPYLAAIAVSVAGAYWLHGIVTQNAWFNQSWSGPVNWRLVGQHLLFVGVYDHNQFDNPIWSLIHEMRISLVFPWLCALVLLLKNRWSAAIAAGLTAVAFAINKWPLLVHWELPDSLFYAALFVLGIVLARERQRLSAWFLHLQRFTKILIAIACVWLYLFAGPELAHASGSFLAHAVWYISHWITALGAGGLIILSFNAQWWQKILAWRPIHLLGKMSYSLYLWHFVVMLYCVHLLYGRMPLGAILILAFVLSIVVSWCSYRWIELPSIALGRKLSDIRWTRPKNVKTQGDGDRPLAPTQGPTPGIDTPESDAVGRTSPA